MITLSINVLLLDKNRFKEVTLKSGKQAKYCELVLIDTPNGQYGDYIVKQGVTKEERAAKFEMPILGNGKILERSNQTRSSRKPEPENPIAGEDIPF